MAVWMGHRTETAHMQGPMEVQTKRNTLDAALDGLLCLVRSVDVDVWGRRLSPAITCSMTAPCLHNNAGCRRPPPAPRSRRHVDRRRPTPPRAPARRPSHPFHLRPLSPSLFLNISPPCTSHLPPISVSGCIFLPSLSSSLCITSADLVLQCTGCLTPALNLLTRSWSSGLCAGACLGRPLEPSYSNHPLNDGTFIGSNNWSPLAIVIDEAGPSELKGGWSIS